jgi:hypothetical protein
MPRGICGKFNEYAGEYSNVIVSGVGRVCLAEHVEKGWKISSRMRRPRFLERWWARQDLNLGPTDYESAALTAELRAP